MEMNRNEAWHREYVVVAPLCTELGIKPQALTNAWDAATMLYLAPQIGATSHMMALVKMGVLYAIKHQSEVQAWIEESYAGFHQEWVNALMAPEPDPGPEPPEDRPVYKPCLN